MLDFDPNRTPPPPRPAATTLVLRQTNGAVEILCIMRHPKSTFLGGMLAFPGGKVEPDDGAGGWEALTTSMHARAEALGDQPVAARARAVTACRETLEEAAVIPVEGLDHEGALGLRERLKAGVRLEQAVRELGRRLDTGAMRPFGRWVTPEAESRRYDATFFLLPLPEGQRGDSDQHETTALFWDTAASLLRRWEAGEFQMAPPTTRMLELLSPVSSIAEALALADRQGLDPVCPRFVLDDKLGGFLALPGDPCHEVKEAVVEGGTRFVMRDGRFVSASAGEG